jgi:rhomboid protease GluP
MDCDAPVARPAPAKVAYADEREELVQAQRFLVGLQQRKPVVTWVLLAAILGVFGLEQLWGGGSTATLVRMGAEVPARIRAGEWWRLLAPTFLHGGFPHLLMNGVVLWMVGGFVERLLGASRFVILYVLAGCSGSVVGTLFSEWSQFTLSVGASGALFGLLGASAVLSLWPRGRIPALIVRDLKKTALFNFGLNVVASLRPNVDYLAHLGGALAGLAVVGSGLLRPPLPALRGGNPSPPSFDGFFRGAAVLCGLALALSLGTALWHGQPWRLHEPLTMTRQPIAGTGLSIAIPELLGPAVVERLENGSTKARFGGLDAPINLTLVITPLDTPIDEPSAVSEMYDQGPRGTVTHILSQTRQRYGVSLKSSVPAELPHNLKLDLAQTLESLRGDLTH